jgi:hypothetical protein
MHPLYVLLDTILAWDGLDSMASQCAKCKIQNLGPRRLIIRIQIRERRDDEFAGLENMLDHGAPRLGRLSFF